MLKNYFKQAWTLMRQNRLFTGIYVVGTGLSIALVMTLFIIFYVKFGPVYPEYNRDRTLVLKPLKRYPKGKPENWTINGGVAYYVVDQMLPGLPHVEQVAGSKIDFWGNYQVSVADVKPFKVTPRFANGAFWKVFSFRFVDGQPFTQEDVEAKAQVAVIGESMAKRLFAAVEGVEGRHFTFNGRDYRVCGVVRDVSNATPETAGDLWLPLLNAQYMSKELDRQGLLGNVFVSLLVDDAENLETVRGEVQDVFRRYTLQDKDYEYDVMGQPDPYWLSTFRQDVEKAPDTMELVKDFLYILLALLFIPALNLSGMISSRMDSRIAELGIRKAYGATRRRLLEQVLCENLLLTLLGGLAGLLFSYLIVLTASDWILTLFDKNIYNTSLSTSLTPEMLFNPAVFGSALAVCVVLNVVSALVPALGAMRHPIMESLNTKR
ncbi:ABC transporter permease [uncultured Bacteroides sp.]|uniref:ABC transporter permease n=1 Tax=uncultured Bacteroides sp. TaxID=162156 RepID=UPI0025969B0A|nr:ABC transporter permease [uncultured Bacteroides sp.]